MLAVLLVGSLLAPIAATGTVAAQTDSPENECMYDAVNWWIFDCTDENPQTVDADQAASEIEKDIHIGGSGIKSSQDQTDQVIQNYLEDTGSIASMEARNTLASAYENETDPAVADTMAQEAINNYYATKQIQLLEDTSSHSTQMAAYANTSKKEAEILDGFVYGAAGYDSAPLTGNTTEHEVTLANGSVHNVTLPEFQVTAADGSTAAKSPNLIEMERESEDHEHPNSYRVSDIGSSWGYLDGSVHLLNTGSLEAKTIYDFRLTQDRFNEIANQSDTVVANYDSGTAQEFYTALDSGEIETNDLRGAEGMVRYLSGDGNVTDQRYQYALRSVMDMDRTSLNSTMFVDFEGATERTRMVNNSTGAVTYEYNSVNKSYEGVLFTDETPAGGFETGMTYDVSNLNGTQRMVTGGADGNTSDVVFYRGNMTITKMTDGDGNEVNQTDITDKPDYGTFNATEYQRVTDKADSERSAITSTYDGSGDGILGGAGGWLPENGSGDMWLAAAFLIAIIAIVASAVTNLAGELGP
ncbi:hypothetical protein [Natrinema ejinorense]|nr:hypothetical protein [Natrinema ejinorense]